MPPDPFGMSYVQAEIQSLQTRDNLLKAIPYAAQEQEEEASVPRHHTLGGGHRPPSGKEPRRLKPTLHHVRKLRHLQRHPSKS